MFLGLMEKHEYVSVNKDVQKTGFLFYCSIKALAILVRNHRQGEIKKVRIYGREA